MDPYNQNTAPDNGTTVDAAPEPDTAPETTASTPDALQVAEIVYTKDIATTAWATISKWQAGTAIPSERILAYIQKVGYTTTAGVDANADTGIVTIVTTGSELTDTLWQGFSGNNSELRYKESSTWDWNPPHPPTLEILIGLWFWYVKNGSRPVRIARIPHETNPDYSNVHTEYYASTGSPNIFTFAYEAPTTDQVRSIKVVSEAYPPGQQDSFYIVAQDQRVLEIETGVDLEGVRDPRDLGVTTGETAQVPSITKETRGLDFVVTSGYFASTTAPDDPREGDTWLNTTTGVYARRVAGEWVVISEATLGTSGSTGVGRSAKPTHYSTSLFGFLAKAMGRGASAFGAYAEAAGEYGVAVGNYARAAARTVAIGRGATVPDTSTRSFVIGHSGSVPENSPDTGVLQANTVQVRPSFVSGGNNQTALALLSPDGTLRAITIGDDGKARIGGVLVAGSGLVSPVPGASSSTDGGYLMGQAIPSGMISEISGEILTFGINAPQIGARDESRVGGIFQLDSRAVRKMLALIGYTSGGSLSARRLTVRLDTGDTVLAPSTGNVGIGIAYDAIASARLQLPAGAGTPGKAPLKLTSGTKVFTPEPGAIEYDGTFWTTNAAGVRSALEKVGHTQPASSISDLGVAVSTIPSMNVRNANVSLPSAPFSILDAGNGVKAIEASSYQARLELDWDALNAYLANLNPLNARGVRASDSGLTGSTVYVDLGDPLLSIPVSSASAHSITVRGTLGVEVTTSTTLRHFLGKIVVSGVGDNDGLVSTSPSVIAADHGPKVIVYLPLVWTGTFTPGTTTIGAKIQFRSGQAGTFLKILSGTSLIMDVKPLA